MPTSDPVMGAISDISGFLLSYATTLAALGALTMAILEAWKKLQSSQAKFHRRMLLTWFGNPVPEQVMASREVNMPEHFEAYARLPSYDHKMAFEQLIYLTTGIGTVPEAGPRRFAHAAAMASSGTFKRSVENALFELDTDRLMGQIQDAADVALNNPARYSHLFRFLTQGASMGDVARWLDEVSVLVSSRDTDDQRRKEIADRYTRLKQTVRRHLDSFQIVAALEWRERNQLAAMAVGAVLLLLAQFIALGHGGSVDTSALDVIKGKVSSQPWLWVKIPVVALCGGMLAPVAKDLVDALKKVKANV